MGLNEMEPSLREKIAPTDSRLRLDMRYMEEGNLGTNTWHSASVKSVYMRQSCE